MKILINEKLSEHKYKTPEGYLICVDSVLARTGKQTYRRNEVFGDSDDDSEIEIDRPAKEVFSDATLASFENKPITVEHPDEDVNAENYKDYAVGFVRDVHKGVDNGMDVIVGTLVITDAKTIEEIENGEHTDLSCGYDCDIVDEENPQQRNIRGNHVALCAQGRAGNARIVDTAVKDMRLPPKWKKDIQRILHARSTFTKRDIDVSEIVNEIERYMKIDGHPLTLERERINGWNKMGDGMMRKDYTFGIRGYDDKILISLYADPDTWKVTEVNGYFRDSIEEETMTKDEIIDELLEDGNSFTYKNILVIKTPYGWKFKLNGKTYEVATDEEAKEEIDESVKDSNIKDGDIDFLKRGPNVKTHIWNKHKKSANELYDLAKRYGIKIEPMFGNGYKQSDYDDIWATTKTSNVKNLFEFFTKLNNYFTVEKLKQYYEYQTKSKVDSIEDATYNYEIRWIDTYAKFKGYPDYKHIDNIKASNLKEALQKLADTAGFGIGTVNMLIINIKKDGTTYQYTDKLYNLLKKKDLADEDLEEDCDMKDSASEYKKIKERLEKARKNKDKALLKTTGETIMWAPTSRLSGPESRDLWKLYKEIKKELGV